jgi:hypothetical protein
MPLSINTKQLAIRVHQGRLLRKGINEKEPDLMEKSQRRMKVTAWWESNGTRLQTRSDDSTTLFSSSWHRTRNIDGHRRASDDLDADDQRYIDADNRFIICFRQYRISQH